ncbi:MAG: hypothetical protein H0X39_01770 [Actinobacteria bacterium]|nr:hypothetical protein [Actinomycetota bacterium]
MTNENLEIEALKAQRYTVQNKLSSVRERLKGNPSPEKRRQYDERKAALTAERERLSAAIKALKAD